MWVWIAVGLGLYVALSLPIGLAVGRLLAARSAEVGELSQRAGAANHPGRIRRLVVVDDATIEDEPGKDHDLIEEPARTLGRHAGAA